MGTNHELTKFVAEDTSLSAVAASMFAIQYAFFKAIVESTLHLAGISNCV